MNRQERQSELKSSHGFTCQCFELCHESCNSNEDLITTMQQMMSNLETLKSKCSKKRGTRRKENIEYNNVLNSITELLEQNRIVQDTFVALKLEEKLMSEILIERDQDAFETAQKLLKKYQILAGDDHESTNRIKHIVKNFQSILSQPSSLLCYF